MLGKVHEYIYYFPLPPPGGKNDSRWLREKNEKGNREMEKEKRRKRKKKGGGVFDVIYIP